MTLQMKSKAGNEAHASSRPDGNLPSGQTYATMQHQQRFRKTDSLKLSISSKLNCNRKSNIYFNEEVVLKKNTLPPVTQ